MTATQAKRRRLINNIIKYDGDKVRAYQQTYPDCKSKQTAQNTVNKILRTEPEVRESISNALTQQGLGEVKLNNKLLQLVDWQKAIVTPQGKIVKVDDGNLQLEATKTAYRLHGHLSTGSSSVVDNRQVTVTINSPDTAALTSVANDLKAMQTALLMDNGDQGGELSSLNRVRGEDEGGSNTEGEVVDAEYSED